MDTTWYLAADFQLFLITPLLVYPLWRWRKKFFWFLPVLVVLIMICTGATMYVNEIPVYLNDL
jgi:peptidoglycan/LPS O-acetylase OafA/YrhL